MGETITLSFRSHSETESTHLGPAWGTYDPERQTLWLEVQDDDWTAAYRLVFQGSEVVLAEMRVFPTESRDQDPPLEIGDWSGEPTSVPHGGLKARRLRGFGVGRVLDLLPDALGAVRAQLGDAVFADLMRQRDLPVDIVERITESHLVSDRRTRLARLAKLYVDQVQAGQPNPVTRVARNEGVSPATVRDFIHQARRDGLLTRPESPGVAGGELTALAKEVLRDAAQERVKES